MIRKIQENYIYLVRHALAQELKVECICLSHIGLGQCNVLEVV